MNIFVSHIHEEFPIANAIKSELETSFGEQVRLFLAEEIPLGKNWFSEIRKALQKANLIFVVFSPVSKSRPWINIEAGYGVMSKKPVIPICSLGLTKIELPVVYGLQQAILIDDAGDVGRLFDELAKKTPARRLLTDRDTAVRRWLEAIKRASSLAPTYSARIEDEPFIWLIGSDHDLPKDETQLTYRVADSLARAFVSEGFRIVMGRNRLLSYVGDVVTHSCISDDETTMRGDPILKTFGFESARANVVKTSPNPVVVLGSLRSKQGVRAIFLDTLQKVPDIAVVIGGSREGRATEEVALAESANIPVLTLQFTGGAAAAAHSSLHPSLDQLVAAIQGMSRHIDRLGKAVCEVICKQVGISRSGTV